MRGPARKREAVAPHEKSLQVSQSRASVFVQPRSTQRYRSHKEGRDANGDGVVEAIRDGDRRPTGGHGCLREEGLKVPWRQRKRARLVGSETGTQRLRATRVVYGATTLSLAKPKTIAGSNGRLSATGSDGNCGAGNRETDGGLRGDPQRKWVGVRGACGAGLDRAARVLNALYQARQPVAERLQEVPSPVAAALRASCGRSSCSTRIHSRLRDDFRIASLLEAKVFGK